MIAWLSTALAQEAPALDGLTVASLSVANVFVANFVHEAGGHGVFCSLGGGSWRRVSTAYQACSRLSPGASRWSAAGGSIAQLTVGSGLASALYLAPPEDGATYYAAWLGATVNLFQGAGNMAVGPWVPELDFSRDNFFSEVERDVPGRIAVSATGVVLMGAGVFVANDLLDPLLGAETPRRGQRRALLTLVPYFSGAAALSLSTVLDRDTHGRYWWSPAIATLAGTLPLAYLPLFFSDDVFVPGGRTDEPARPITRSPAWIVTSAVVAVAAVSVLGPGIGPGYEAPHPLDFGR